MMPMRRPMSGGAILAFHSITTPELPGEGTAHVSLEAFQSFIRVARRLGELVRLSELVRRHQHGQSTSGLIAVTLDDAYAALHGEFREFVLQEAVPITVFVVTQAAAIAARYWWDRIDDVFPRVAPDRWRAFGCVPERAHALLGLGRARLALGALDARAPLEEARDLFGGLGAVPLVERADALLGRPASRGS